jgi:formiminoglutamate deiminase
MPEGWRQDVRLVIKGGRWSAIEVGALPRSDDHHVTIALPGLANLHSHAFQRGMAGLAEQRGPAGDSFWTWREVMYRFTARLGPDALQAIAAQAYVEMLETGFTRVAEFHYLHHQPSGHPYDDPAEMSRSIADAAEQTGIGLTLLPVFYAQGGFGGADCGPAQARFRHEPSSYASLLQACQQILRPLPGARLGIAPHSLRAVTPEQLRQILPLAAGGPVHIHIAEQIREVEDCLAWSGARPVEWLLGEMPVDQHWCLVHATHMTPAEVAGLADSGAVAGLCPITEANLGDGLFPLVDFIAAGGRFGIGTDSNVLISLAEEMRLLEYGQRLQHRGRNIAPTAAGQSTGGVLFRAALAGGGLASGETSELVVGGWADLVSLGGAHPSLVARSGDHWLDSLIFAGGAIDEVWRAGHRLVEGGRHYRRDPIAASYRDALRRILD